MALPALAIPAALGAAEAVAGLFKSGKAKRQAAELERTRPELANSPFVADQLALAQSEFANGMSAEAESAFGQGIDRDLSTSLDAILKGGGDVNNVADIFDRSQVGRQRLSMMKENLRLSQINNLVNAQGAAENERLQQFEFNDWRPWADKAQGNAQARQGAENMIWGGLQTAGAAATSFLQGQNAQQDYNNYLSTERRVAPNPNLKSTQVQGPVQTYNPQVGSPANQFDFINIDDTIFR
jgi:hypothetical protein